MMIAVQANRASSATSVDNHLSTLLATRAEEPHRGPHHAPGRGQHRRMQAKRVPEQRIRLSAQERAVAPVRGCVSRLTPAVVQDRSHRVRDIGGNEAPEEGRDRGAVGGFAVGSPDHPVHGSGLVAECLDPPKGPFDPEVRADAPGVRR